MNSKEINNIIENEKIKAIENGQLYNKIIDGNKKDKTVIRGYLSKENKLIVTYKNFWETHNIYYNFEDISNIDNSFYYIFSLSIDYVVEESEKMNNEEIKELLKEILIE